MSVLRKRPALCCASRRLKQMKADPTKPSISKSEDEFYDQLPPAEQSKLRDDLAKVKAANAKCKLLPDAETRPECNRYYKMGQDENNRTDFNDWKRSEEGQKFMNENPASVKRKETVKGKERGTTMEIEKEHREYPHRVPINAGGCPLPERIFNRLMTKNVLIWKRMSCSEFTIISERK